jgi:ferritin-like metal-binding protein YciE
MTKINDASNAFLTKIQVLYDIEKKLEKALPKLAKASANPELEQGFMDHLEETIRHSGRLEEIFEMLGAAPKKLTSEAIKGIIDDGEWCTKVTAPDNIKDSMIAAAARYAEHYEIAGYKTAILEADSLGLSDASALLKETLVEEENADSKLEEVIIKNFR